MNRNFAQVNLDMKKIFFGFRLSDMVCFSEIRGCHSGMLFKDAVKHGFGVESCIKKDIKDVFIVVR